MQQPPLAGRQEFKLTSSRSSCRRLQLHCQVMANPSLERTSTGKALGPRSGVVHHPHRGPSALPAAAAQLKRWAIQMRNAPCLLSTSVLGAERGGSGGAGCSPCGSQRTLAAPRSRWRANDGGALSINRSIMHSNTPTAIVRAGRPSYGGQRTSGGGSSATNQLWSPQDRRGVHAPRGLAQQCSGTYRPLLGPPNPSLKRTCLRQAA